MIDDGVHTLGCWIRDCAALTPDRVAIDDRGVILTYGGMNARAQKLANGFHAAGYVAGDRIATLTGNSSDHIVLFFACAIAGLVLVPLSWRLSARELSDQLFLSDPALLVVEDEFTALAQAALKHTLTPIAITALGSHGIEETIPSQSRRKTGESVVREVRDDDPVLLVFTSGTLDKPKGVVLTHANCFWTNLSLSRAADITSRDVVLAIMPQYHVGGWNIQPLLALWAGATVVLERTFDAGRVLQLIADRGVTTMMGVPTNYQLLAQHPDFTAAQLGTLRYALVGGAPMPAPLLRIWHQRGVQLIQGYGLSEASPNVLCLAAEDTESHLGSAGKPYPHVRVALVDPVSNERIDGPGEGELLVRGPAVFPGYFRDPVATAETLSDGWLRTGDLVRRDADGYYTVVDRIKDIYISGGEGISPAEIESVLMAHSAVADAAVAGVPDQQWGEVGVAWVVMRPDQFTDEEELLQFAQRSLARFKVPKRILFVTEIPRSGSSKILRRLLLGQWTDEQMELSE